MATAWKVSPRWIATAAIIAGGLAFPAVDVSANANPPTSSPSKDCKSTPAVVINGGTMTNQTNLDLSANGGTAVGDATGGNSNVANEGASAGNGGGADAGASGGAIQTQDINSGNNTGMSIGVGDTIDGNLCDGVPAVQVSGGEVSNITNVKVSANGGTAIADASGGDNNVALNGGRAGNGGVSSAGNGGSANAAANGGAVSLGNINSGSNVGNTISVGDTIAGGAPIIPVKPGEPGKPGKPVCCATPGKPGASTPGKGGKNVTALPSTGSGSMLGGLDAGSLGTALGSALAAAGSAVGGFRRRREA